MTVKDIKKWINSLPKDFDNYPIVIVGGIEEIDNEKFIASHVPVASVMINIKMKEACIFNERNIKLFDKLTS